MTILETPLASEPIVDSSSPEVDLPQLNETLEMLNQQLDNKGDTLDRIKSMRRVSGLGTMALGAAALGVNEALFSVTYSHDTVAGAISMAGIVAGAMLGSRKLGRSRQRKNTTEILQTQHALQQYFDGEVVEVFSSKRERQHPRQRTVVWDGNTEIDEPLSDYMHERLKQLREVAKGVGAQEVGVPKEYLKDYMDEDQPIGRTEEFNAWLKDYKKLNVSDEARGKNEVQFVDLEELDDLIDSIEISSLAEEPLRSIMKVLTHYKPNHQALKWYGVRAQNPEQADKQLKRLFKGTLERRLQDVERTRDVDEDFVVETSKVHTLGRLRSVDGKAKIDWHQAEKNLHLATSDLLGQYKLQYSDLQRILAHPESFSPNKVVELCELAAWLTLEGHDIGMAADEGSTSGTHSVMSDEMASMDSLSFGERMQQQVLGYKEGWHVRRKKHEIDDSMQFAKRVFKAIALVSFAGYIGLGLAKSTDNYATREDNAYSAQHGYVNDFYTDNPDPIIRTYAMVIDSLDSFHGVSNNIASAIQQRLGIQYTAEESKHLQQVTSPPSGGNSEDRNNNPTIGNVNGNEENKPMWYIQSYDGMDSTGYWTENTYNRLGWSQVDWVEDFSAPQDPDTPERALAESVALPSSLGESSDPRLRIQRLVNFDSRSSGTYQDTIPYGTKSSYKWVNVPTKEGTRIVAASINGQDGVKVYTMTDGLQVLLVPSDVDDPFPKLEYWLSNDTQAPRPKFKEPVNFYEFGTKLGGDEPGTLANQINTSWQPLVPDLPVGGMERVTKQEDYIRHNFYYELAPLREPKLTESRKRYASYVLDHKEANCNVAAALLNLSNPDELNFAVGYANGSQNEDDSAYLGSHEAHAWNIDKKGQIHDSTPTQGLSVEEQKFFEENFTEKEPTSERERQQQRVLMVAKLGVLAAAAGAIFVNRRKLHNVKIGVQRSVAERMLKRTSDHAIHVAASTLDYATYAPDSDNLTAALQSKSPSAQAEREIIETFGANSFKTAKRNLKTIRASTKEERKAKRMAKHLVRTAYRANR